MEPDDAIRVREFVLTILVGEHELTYRRRDLDRIMDEYRSPDSLFLVATRAPGEYIVGTAAVKYIQKADIPLPGDGKAADHRQPIGMLKRMYVAREQRGQGIGAALYSAIEDHSVQQGFLGLYLDTDSSMETAMAFYRRRGFSRLERPLVDPGTSFEGCLHYFWKPL